MAVTACDLRGLLGAGGCIDFGRWASTTTRRGETDRAQFGEQRKPDLDHGQRAIKLTQSLISQHSFVQQVIAICASKQHHLRAEVIFTEVRNCIWPVAAGVVDPLRNSDDVAPMMPLAETVKAPAWCCCPTARRQCGFLIASLHVPSAMPLLHGGVAPGRLLSGHS